MAAFTTVLAFDLGASTGRAICAVYDGERLQWKEIHRFDNIPAVENGHLKRREHPGDRGLLQGG